MIFISHRGNIIGKDVRENAPDFIDEAIHRGYDVEIDIRYLNDELYLGHDMPDYKIDLEWLNERTDNLWVHCKNLSAIEYLNNSDGHDLNYFWHDEDEVTLTSKGFIWAYPEKQPIKRSIAVLPELFDDDVRECYGICSDVIQNYMRDWK